MVLEQTKYLFQKLTGFTEEELKSLLSQNMISKWEMC